MKSVVETDKSSIEELKRALAEAMGKFEPDRSSLPIPDRAFGGTAGARCATPWRTGRSSRVPRHPKMPPTCW